MASVVHGTTSLFGPLGVRFPLSLFLVASVLLGYLAQVTTSTSLVQHGRLDHYRDTEVVFSANSCTVTWGSPPIQPIHKWVTNLWLLDSEVSVNDQYEDELDEMDSSEFEIYLYNVRLTRLHQAIQRARCVLYDWPELDLPWCLADWHNGKLIPETRSTLGETCYWNCPCYGWEARDADTYNNYWGLGLAPHSWVILIFFLITIGIKDYKDAALQHESEIVKATGQQE